MKHLINSILLLCIIIASGCDNEDIVPSMGDLEKQVSDIVGANQETPNKDQVQDQEWKCSSWDINFYKAGEKVGDWNGYDNTIQTNEKSQVYRLSDGLFGVMSDENELLDYKYEWKDNGVLTINDIELIFKMDGDDLFIYYQIKDAVAVSKVFNVSIDNTYSDGLNEAEVEGLGIIKFVERNPVNDEQNSDMTTQKLIEDYLAQNEIEGSVYMGIEIEGLKTIILDKGNKPAIALNFETMSGVQLTNQRAESLFNALILRDGFSVLNYEVDIARISFYENYKNIFKVSGFTQAQESVSFLYNIDKDEQSWLIEPTNNTDINNEISASDLVQNFIDKKEIFGGVYLELRVNGDNWLLIGDNTEVEFKIIGEINLSQIESEGAIPMFRALLTEEAYGFEAFDIDVTSIKFKEAEDLGFIVGGNTISSQEYVEFYINIKNNEEEWIKSPSTEYPTIASYDLVQYFNDRKEIYGNIYNRIQPTDDPYRFILDGYKNVLIANQTFDLSNVTTSRAKDLYTTFFQKKDFTFLNVVVSINEISHESGNGGNLIVKATTVQLQESVEFYYDTNSDKEHWLTAPQ